MDRLLATPTMRPCLFAKSVMFRSAGSLCATGRTAGYASRSRAACGQVPLRKLRDHGEVRIDDVGDARRAGLRDDLVRVEALEAVVLDQPLAQLALGDADCGDQGAPAAGHHEVLGAPDPRPADQLPLDHVDL